MAISCETLIHHVHLASCRPDMSGPGVIRDALVAVADGRIVYAGAASTADDFEAGEHVDGAGGWLTPGLIDCHTHLVWAGNRSDEFERRLRGESYASIARGGGGILSTVRATREASEETLFADAAARLARLREEGVTSVEIKSGYGLSTAAEMKMLRVARRLGEAFPVTVRTTLLGAHALPEEYAGRADDYVDLVCGEMIPAACAEGLADAVDVYCEDIAFSLPQCERIFIAAREHGLAIKAHAEQLSEMRGALLAARYGARSVDHLEYLAAADVPALAHSGCIAVMLPGAWYTLRETRLPPVDALRTSGVPMAVATDLNPGTSPIASLLSAMNMACVQFGLTPAEALLGVTRHAASALALAHKGQIAADFDADLCLWAVDHPGELSYGMNLIRPARIWQAGRDVAAG